jgi:dTMP kinase
MTVQASTDASTPPRSPRMAALARALSGGDSQALEAFWREIATTGAPLIEHHLANSSIREGTMLVTFVVKATGVWNEGDATVYGELGDTQSPWPVHGALSRLSGSDVLFRTYEMSDRARFSYHLSRRRSDVDDPQAQAKYSDEKTTYELFLDPLNRKSYSSAWAEKLERHWIEDKVVHVSYAEGPRAPREPFIAERPGVRRGKVVTLDFDSALLGNKRKITIYTPPGADRGSPDCDFLLLFDRASYLTAVPTPTLLDNMLADDRIRPIVAVLVGNTEKPGRGAELPPNPLFQKALREELLPWLWAEALLYAAARAQHVEEVIAPALERGAAVICDRYVDSSAAYQGAGRELGLERVLELNLAAVGRLLPDRTFLFELDVDAIPERLTSDHDRLERESRAFFVRAAAGYRELAGRFPDRIVVLDASRPAEELAEEVYGALRVRT